MRWFRIVTIAPRQPRTKDTPGYPAMRAIETYYIFPRCQRETDGWQCHDNRATPCEACGRGGNKLNYKRR